MSGGLSKLLKPDRDEVVSLADQYISNDSLVRPSIEDGYIAREEYVVNLWLNEFQSLNDDDVDVSDEAAYELSLEKACKAAAEEFGLPLETVQEIERRARNIRARNLPGFEEQVLKDLEKEEVDRVLGKDDTSEGRSE